MIETKRGRPSGTEEKALLSLLKGKRGNVDVSRAHDIYTREFKREEMESCLLSEMTPSEIETVLGVPVSVTKAYIHLFFDITAFEDRLDRIDYAYNYPEKYGKELKTLAVDLGKDCMMIRASRGAHTIDPKKAQESVRSTAYTMAQVARINSVVSEESKAAFRWAQLCLRSAGELPDEKLGTGESINIAVESCDDSTNEKKSGIKPTKIMHGEHKDENSET